MKTKENRRKLAPFESLGVELGDPDHDDNARGHCPFCGKENHFYVNAANGQWDCKRCGIYGNLYNFLEYWAAENLNNTSERDYQWLSETRGIPVEGLKRYHLAWDGGQWLIPVSSDKGTIRDIRRYDGKRIRSTEGCSTQLFGIWELARAKKGTFVWVCEGEWDAIALRWLLDAAGYTDDVVVGVPGAHTFKKEWYPFFFEKNTIFCFDNDEAGDDGSLKNGQALQGIAESVQYLNWPDTRPSGWDINDFVKEGLGTSLSPEEGVVILIDLVSPIHRRMPQEEIYVGPTISEGELPTFSDLLILFHKWAKMDQLLEDTLAVCLAACLANDVPGEPLWLYLVGPPGSGKTMILNTLKHSERVVFQSTMSPKSLVSGFSAGPDPSMLPRFNGKCAVFKDATELLAAHPDVKKETYATLGGAFDGYVFRPFGNAQHREYKDLHFNMLMGVTDLVHADSQATMGERFLKFQSVSRNRDLDRDKIRRALQNISLEKDMETELCGAVQAFLRRRIDPTSLPDLPQWFEEKVIAFAQLVGMLRAEVKRETYGDRDMLYRPTYEVGTRAAKQLAKLGQMLACVFDQWFIDANICRIVEHAAYSTMIGFHLDIIRAIAESGGITCKEKIIEQTGIPASTLYRRMNDMAALNILIKTNPPPNIKDAHLSTDWWTMAPYVRRTWSVANYRLNGDPYESHEGIRIVQKGPS